MLQTSRNGGKDCIGNSRITQQCQKKQCPVAVDCKWSNWEKSGTCSKSCGGGTQTWQRTELIKSKYGGTPCQGEATFTEDCNTVSCPDQGKWISCYRYFYQIVFRYLSQIESDYFNLWLSGCKNN